ncbi:hypothetical protein [Sorangium sp. So ce124]|uniref:hypothetical protein n=1 Tax=Sorangium sp. So ce124 TaxID=3133280 RepID=UPI003F61831E
MSVRPAAPRLLISPSPARGRLARAPSVFASFEEHMKAIVATEYGPPDVLQLGEVDIPPVFI